MTLTLKSEAARVKLFHVSIKKIASTFRRHPSDNWLNNPVLENIEFVEETKNQRPENLIKTEKIGKGQRKGQENEILFHEFNSENFNYDTKM